METDPVSETSCFLVSRIPEDGPSPKTPRNFEYYSPSSEPFRIYWMFTQLTTRRHSAEGKQKETNFKFTLLLSQLHFQREPTLWPFRVVRRYTSGRQNKNLGKGEPSLRVLWSAKEFASDKQEHNFVTQHLKLTWQCQGSRNTNLIYYFSHWAVVLPENTFTDDICKTLCYILWSGSKDKPTASIILLLCFTNIRSQYSVVRIATAYELHSRGFAVRVPRISRMYSPPVGHTDSGTHLASYLMVTVVLYPGVKRPGVKLTIYLQLVPRSRKCGSIRPLPPHVLMA
jgi:hypothetical protein